MNRIYMDHSATTQMSEKALEAMLPYFREDYGNPSAVYSYGQTAHNALEKCRNRVAKAIGALPTEIFFTSGGTESDNWVIRSICAANWEKRGHIISTEIEHNAVRRTLEQMQEYGFEVTYLKPDDKGRITPQQLEEAIREDTILITIMQANNVVGTILDIKALTDVSKKHKIKFHTDAVQAVGHIPVSARKLGVDFLSASAHKFNGPKGVGFLFCKMPNRIKPLLTGGGQEREERSSTENVPAIVGMTVALEENVASMEGNMEYLNELAKTMDEAVLNIPGVYPTGDRENKLPGFCSYVVEGISHSVLLVNKLNEKGICVSSGSACSASSKEASHVLLSLGYDEKLAGSSLRITMGMDNTKEDVLTAAEAVKTAIEEVRTETVSRAPRLEGRVSEIGGK